MNIIWRLRARFIRLANLAWLGLAWQAKAPQSFTRLSPSDKLRTAGVRSFSPSTEGRHRQPATINQLEVLSTLSKAHRMPLKLAKFHLTTLDKEGRCISRFNIYQFSIGPNF
jgi:hypothetical protein